jgi:lactobin A/cerein 7B family class IIb bacteriocin
MSLENLNLVEMSHSEMNEVEGGIWPIIVAFLVGALASEIAHHH